MYFSNRSRGAGASLVLLLLAMAADAKALGFITSADICAPVHVGKANAYVKNINGTIQNLSFSTTMAVSCPILTVFGASELDVVIRPGNAHGFHQTYQCVLREKDTNDYDIRKYVSTVSIAPGSSGAIAFDKVSITNAVHRFNLTCSLPPRSSLGLLGMESN